MALGLFWSFFITLTSFYILGAFLDCCCRCWRTRDREQEQDQEQQQQQLHQQDQQENQQSELTEEAKQQERRLKILINIIHKKVLPKQESYTNDDNKEDIDTSSLLLPHEKSLSRRASLKRSTESFDDNCNDSDGNIEIDVPQWFLSSTVIQSQPNHEGTSIDSNWDENIIPFPVPVPSPQSQLEEEEESNGKKKQKILKNNIFEQSMRSLRKVMGIQGVSNSSLYSPKVCPICMEPYKAGDEIAWSKNEECHHAFHLDCILKWLMNNDECPMCRGDYLCTTGSDCEA